MNKKISLVLVLLGLSARVWGAIAVAEIKNTVTNSPMGTVRFEDTAAGLQIQAQLANVPPGIHAFHIHEFGSCVDTGKAAGGHYNPEHAPHGQVLKDGVQHAHAGDLGNVTAGPNGSASLQATIPGVTLAEGKYTVAGRAVVLHEKVDDFSQPVGNAGSRIACGSILLLGVPAVPPVAPPVVK